jgi:DNA-binding SARP family transcriptional activator/DNA-binding GntR family transcriptional regulator/DNA-binding Lrp family transcriptional regulator
MELRVLGPFDAQQSGTPIALGSPRARALLARLAIDANRAVPTSQLIDDLWGETVPETAAKMVQVYVSHLRKVLPADVLLTMPPGYAVQLDPEDIDLTRFIRLRAEGREALATEDPATASARFHDALALWRGPALAEFSEPFAQVEGAHLDELRLDCVEDRIRSDLALGRHADLVAELELLVASHPLRETLHSSLMLALYRSGRQAEALRAYDRFRRALDDELGLEPSRALKALQHRVLNQDPSLDLAGRTVVPASPAPTSPAAPAGLRGRDAELSRLESAVAAAAVGDGSAILISGPAGIGKTRLRTELTERAHERGVHVLVGRCIQLVGTGLPYLPVVDALRPLRGSHVLEDLAEELQELPGLLPELTAQGRHDRAAPVAAESRLRLFEEVLAVLERLTADAPVMLVLEDLHWADASTLDLVAFLAHTVSSKRILLVLTSRTEGDHLQALTSAAVVTPIPLEPLDDVEIEVLLSDCSTESPSVDLLRGITRRAQGNPFFARELLAAARRGDGSLPPRLRDVLLATVARLDASTRSLLRVVAATGRAVSYRLLADVTSLSESELGEALRQATEHDVLVPDHAALTYGFRHELYAEAVYGTLLPGERELLHERLARALSDEPGLAARSGAAEPAQHWAAAGRPVEALGASLQAAREAEAVSGLTEALGHVERVLELWDEVPRAEQLAGVGLPSVLAWAVDLAGASARSEDTVDAGQMLAALAPGEALHPDALAQRLGVRVDAAASTLEMLERDGLVERVGDAVRPAPLAVTEASRLYPSAVVLESLAIRQSPPFAESCIATLRGANERLRAVRTDPAAAATADDDFHRLLTVGCGNEHLLAALAPIKRALLRYERVYMLEPERVDRSAAQHDAIIAALARGDHAEAAQRVRGNLAYGLDELRDVIDG